MMQPIINLLIIAIINLVKLHSPAAINADDSPTALQGDFLHRFVCHESFECCSDNIELASVAMDCLGTTIGNAKVLENLTSQRISAQSAIRSSQDYLAGIGSTDQISRQSIILVSFNKKDVALAFSRCRQHSLASSRSLARSESGTTIEIAFGGRTKVEE